MTNLIPDSWELPSYTAGDVYDLDAHRALQTYERGGPREDHEWEEGEGAPVIRFPEAVHAHVPEWTDPDPHSDWTDAVKALREIEPYDPAKHGPMEPGDLTSVDSLQALEREGFEPHEPGVWHRRVRHENGDPTGMHHIITYEPGHRRPTNDERAPWILTTDPETAGVAFRHLDGPTGALAAANEDRAQIRRMSKLGTFIRRLHKAAAGQSRGRRDADDWLERNTDESFEHVPEVSNEAWMRAHEGLGEDEGYTTWHPEIGDYTYNDVGDASGWEFSGGDEARPTAMPGHFRDENRVLNSPSSRGHGWSQQDYEDHRAIERERQRAVHPPTRQHEDEEDYEPPEHERAFEELGFNWENRGDRDTTPVGIYQEGQYVRHQHTPEGEHIATHTIYRDPATNSWHTEYSPADTPGFVESHTQHQWPHDAITQYHHNAEQALLPQRGYQPHRGRSGVITRWTRTDTSPTGDVYEHEISNQPPSGEGNAPGWLGQTFGDHFNQVYAPHGMRNQPVQTDLADVVREHDRIGRGLHPGGAQDYRITRNELLNDPSVARLGEPRHVSDGFFGDGKVGSARWSWSHPHWPHPINAEATYNWDKGGYDFKYTTDGTTLAASHNYVPEGAPMHVPGRQMRLPIEGS